MAKKSPTTRRRTAAKKTGGRSTAKRRPVRKPRAGSRPKVRVRMYRQGLGDCFLITFDAGGDERHMMIDCGTLGATTTGV